MAQLLEQLGFSNESLSGTGRELGLADFYRCWNGPVFEISAAIDHPHTSFSEQPLHQPLTDLIASAQTHEWSRVSITFPEQVSRTAALTEQLRTSENTGFDHGITP